MKRSIVCALLAALLLCGCGGGEEAEAARRPYQVLQSVQMEAELCCHLETESRSFTVRCDWDRDRGAGTTVTAPEELAGLTATLSGEALQLDYAGELWDAGSLRDIVPANCLPWLLRALAEGYLLESGREELEGEDCLRLSLDTTAPSGGKVLCSIWLRRADGVPCYAEFSQDGRVVLTARLLSFTSS